ncbi:MAG: c-type cytochrome [Planctomycetota bacterium]|nr:c-type cytochrome [Planctomycetota bacterium]
MMTSRAGRGRQPSCLATAVAVWVGAVASGAVAGPVSPAEGPATLALPPDLAAPLFAAEPLLSSPADIDVDSSGRVWVCEVTNYRGRKDTRPEGDRILVLEDTDGDGAADKQTVFHQGRDVDSALGICVIGEGKGRKVIVSCAPEVLVFHDDDGDLVADRREVLFTKTGQPQHDHSVHAFVVGPDGRWYFNFGNTGRAVHNKDGKPVVDRFGNVVNDSGKPYRQGMVFRCKPDGSDFEVLGHNFRNNYEVAVDSFGSLWQSDNDDDGNRGVRINAVVEFGNYGYVDERTGAGWRAGRTNLEPEIPQRHWHQNDPGVMPNLLLTGGGSPTGICVYEGSLLPERFRGALVHCDAGPNVVRAYPVRPRGAGWEARIEPVADGSADRWFRPSDVCVAPDGSLIVADWYDPGVGGHGMGDVEKGRVYRIAPPGAAWTVPRHDLESVGGCVAALASPNLCTRATALERLAANPDAATDALEQAYATAGDSRHKARLAWAAGMLPGRAEAWVARLAAEADDNLRVVAIRLCRRTQGEVLGLVEQVAADASPAVRREAAIALKGVAGERADRAWAALAAGHVAGDRWELEALGIGADGAAGLAGESQWDARLAAWRAMVGDAWKSLAGREIVWRSRAAVTPTLLCEIIGDPATSTNESLACLRALDFQDQAVVAAAVADLLKRAAFDEERAAVVLPELALRLDPARAADGPLAARIAEAADRVSGTPTFVELVRRFRLQDRTAALVTLAVAGTTDDSLAAQAIGLAVELGGEPAIRKAVAADGETTPRLLEVLGIKGDEAAVAMLEATLADSNAPPGLRAAAVRGLARGKRGAERVVALAKTGELSGPLVQAAAAAISACPWRDVRQAAADVLPLPRARGGESLPPVAELVKRRGDPKRGREVFAGAGTCAKCHVVNGEGKAIGPDLSGIGAKLPAVALYEAILAPSAAISHAYETWTAISDDGRSFSGLLISKTDEATVLRGADGIDVSLVTAEIEDLVRQPISLMPADLATVLSERELVDLVAWLGTLKAKQ